jgi:hypothetical protein
MADERRSLSAQSLSNGISTADLVQPICLTCSPAATGRNGELLAGAVSRRARRIL